MAIAAKIKELVIHAQNRFGTYYHSKMIFACLSDQLTSYTTSGCATLASYPGSWWADHREPTYHSWCIIVILNEVN